MATYTIKIDENSEEGKGVLTLLKSLKGVVSIQSSALDESLEEVKEGRVHYAKDARDLIRQCSE